MDRVQRVMNRLLGSRARDFTVVIPWIDLVTAFTAPGRYIFFSRRLYERCATDEEVALVLAHEIAHHDLGHIKVFDPWERRLSQIAGAELIAFAFHAIERRLYGPENECDADRYGLEMCLKAGYDGAKCIEIFDTLEARALDMGDHDMVYGPDDESDDELDENAPWTTKAQIWIFQRKRGCLPIRDRRQMLRKSLENHRG